MRARSLWQTAPDGCVDTGIGNQLIEGLKTLDIINLSQNGGDRDWANPWDGGDVLRDLLHPFSDGQIELGALLFEKVDLSQETAHLNASCICEESDADRLASLL